MGEQSRRKKLLFIFLAIVLLIGLIIAYIFVIMKKNPNNTKSSDKITPSQAYQICTERSCPNTPVTIIGSLQNSSKNFMDMLIKEGDKTIYVDLSEDKDFYNRLKMAEENKLIKNGIINAEVTGELSFEKKFFDTYVDTVNLKTNSNLIRFVQNGECRSSGIPYLIDSNECFDMSNFALTPSDAYQRLLSSSLLGNNFEVTGFTDGPYTNLAWQFSLNRDGQEQEVTGGSRPDGSYTYPTYCRYYAEISLEKSKIIKSCHTVGTPGETKEIINEK